MFKCDVDTTESDLIKQDRLALAHFLQGFSTTSSTTNTNDEHQDNYNNNVILSNEHWITMYGSNRHHMIRYGPYRLIEQAEKINETYKIENLLWELYHDMTKFKYFWIQYIVQVDCNHVMIGGKGGNHRNGGVDNDENNHTKQVPSAPRTIRSLLLLMKILLERKDYVMLKKVHRLTRIIMEPVLECNKNMNKQINITSNNRIVNNDSNYHYCLEAAYYQCKIFEISYYTKLNHIKYAIKSLKDACIYEDKALKKSSWGTSTSTGLVGTSSSHGDSRSRRGSLSIDSTSSSQNDEYYATLPPHECIQFVWEYHRRKEQKNINHNRDEYEEDNGEYEDDLQQATNHFGIIHLHLLQYDELEQILHRYIEWKQRTSTTTTTTTTTNTTTYPTTTKSTTSSMSSCSSSSTTSSNDKQKATMIKHFGTICFTCQRTEKELGKELKVCSKCKSAYYCGLRCQKKDWKQRHQYECFDGYCSISSSSSSSTTTTTALFVKK